jgi:kinesin family member C2/C3
MEYKNCVLDATQMSTSIQEYVIQYAALESEFKDLKEKFSHETQQAYSDEG